MIVAGWTLYSCKSVGDISSERQYSSVVIVCGGMLVKAVLVCRNVDEAQGRRDRAMRGGAADVT